MTKLALIMDKSEAFTMFKKDQILLEWGGKDPLFKEIESFSENGGSDLFGESPILLLRANNKEKIDGLKNALDKMKDSDEIDENFSSGLIITSIANKNSLKKIQKRVEDLGGEVIEAQESKKDDVSSKLLEETGLPRETKQFIIDYVGDDYESLIPILNDLSRFNKKQQNKITPEAMSNRFPQDKGQVKAFLIEQPLFAGDANKTIEVSRRAGDGRTSYLLPLSIVRNKIESLFKVASLLKHDKMMIKDEISEKTGIVNNYGLVILMQRAKKFSYEDIEEAVKVVSDYDDQIRGFKSSVDNRLLFEVMLLDLCQIFKTK